MKQFKTILTGMLATALVLSSCNKQEMSEVNTGSGYNGVIATFQHPIVEGEASTKTLNKNLEFTFEQNAQIDVYPEASGECMVYALTPETGASAAFKVENFNLKDGTYGAVYPADKPVVDPTQIPFSLAGQNQVANDDASHLSAYDLNFAQADITGNTGEFEIKHKVAWIKVSIAANHNRKYDKITLSADEGIANSLTLNATTGVVTSEAQSSSEKLILTLNDGKGFDVPAGSTFAAYMTIPAGNYTNLTIDCGDLSRKISGSKLCDAGHAYTIEIEDFPVDAILGKFSVSDTKQVYFSKGNLWYGKVGDATEATFNFEANQYGFQISWDASHVSHFYWSKTASVAYAEGYNDPETSEKDVLFTNGTPESANADFTVNGVTGKWRTLSDNEWGYLFGHHSHRYATVNGVMGEVVAPDGFSGTLKESYTDDAELAKDNLLFIPRAGDRDGSNISGSEQC